MEHITRIAGYWEHLTHRVLDKEPVSMLELQDLLRWSYEVLTQYHKQDLVPKQIGKLIKRMDAFLYFASMMEEKETGVDFYHYQLLHAVVESMEQGFFCGQYPCAYPKLQVADGEHNIYEIDMESKFLANRG